MSTKALLLVVSVSFAFWNQPAPASEAQVVLESLLGANYHFEGVSAIAVDPTNSQVLYAGDRRGRIATSKDGGHTWNVISEQLRGDESGIGIVCQNVDCETRDIRVDPFHSDTLYLRKFGAYFISRDSGESWHRIGPSGELSTLVLDPLLAGTVYFGTAEGVFKSVDRGSTWEQVLATVVSGISVSPQDSQVLYAVGGRSVFRSVDGGQTWEERTEGLLIEGVETVVSIAVHPDEVNIIYVGVSITRKTATPGIFKTTDGGLSWKPVGLNGHMISTLAIDPYHPEIIYAGGGNKAYPDGTFRSADGGRNWTLIHEAASSMALVLDPLNPQVVYEGTNGALLRYSVGDLATPVSPTSWGVIKKNLE